MRVGGVGFGGAGNRPARRVVSRHRMPGATGFELLQRLGEDAPFQVIFTTAHSEYAIEALRGGAFDYLLKPVQEDELARALDRLTQKKMRAGQPVAIAPPENGIAALLKSLQTLQDKDKKLPVPTAEGVLLLPVADIIGPKRRGVIPRFI